MGALCFSSKTSKEIEGVMILGRNFSFKGEVSYRGAKKQTEVYWSKRNGSKTPEYTWLKIDGRWISPFEQEKFVTADLQFLFLKTYAPHVKQMVGMKFIHSAVK